MSSARSSPARRVLLATVGLVVAAVVAFGVLAPPEHCPEVSAAALTDRATAAVDWFTRNQLDDGTWLYEYDAEADRDLGSYNIVRHAGAIMGLYQAATAEIPGALESADRGRAWILQHLLQRDGWTAVSFEDRTAVGSTALLVAGLVERRLMTGDTADDDLIRQMARFLVAQTEPTRCRAQRLRQRHRRADRRPLLEVLHGRGLLGAGEGAPPVPGRGVG